MTGLTCHFQTGILDVVEYFICDEEKSTQAGHLQRIWKAENRDEAPVEDGLGASGVSRANETRQDC